MAATVEGVKIYSSDVEALVHSYRLRSPSQEGGKASPKTLARSALLHQIRLTFLEHLAANMSNAGENRRPETLPPLTPPAGVHGLGPEELSMVRSFQAGRLNETMAHILFPEVTVAEDAVRAEYARLRVAYEHERFWRARVHIATFASDEPAKQFGPGIDRGEPFREVASTLGALNTETLDLTAISPLPRPILEAIATLPPNRVSPPIHADVRGWAVILVEHREDLPTFSFEDVRGDLTRFLADQRRQALFEYWFDKKLQGARVKVSGYYGRWDAEEAELR